MYLEIPLDYGNQTEMVSLPWDQRWPRMFPWNHQIFSKGYSSSYDGISSWMKSRNAKTACAPLPYTEEQFLNKWEKVELLLILKDPRGRDEPGFQKPLGGSFLYHLANLAQCGAVVECWVPCIRAREWAGTGGEPGQVGRLEESKSPNG